MTNINKNRNLNSTGLTSNILKSKSKNEEQLKNTNKDNLISKIGQAIKQLKIASNDIKKSPPVNKLDMTKKYQILLVTQRKSFLNHFLNYLLKIQP